ncbi:MAG TPA: PRC-barrel domain-containing protein [Leptolyngbyaceae cyanobacterium M33_DOE_097]|uniref:Photosystem reaction center subunit H n=1 Tax=Oscillatoriales cyanobacterium SpSt-418 TaxID=2282169 RepID=A0A7C3KDM2_9CYAN|nr:PRC-barrel domain-containing protein [Leptolyngbyaceae cyanobacterium M33_DOE_097]
MSSANLIKQSDLLGKPVLNRVNAEELGRIDHLWLKPDTHRIIGMTCKSGILGREKHAFLWHQIAAIGGESVVISVTDEIAPEKPDTAIDNAIGYELWTDAGNQAGVIKDFVIDLETGEVTDYLFSSSGWRGITDGIYSLPVRAILTVGSKRMMVTADAAETAEQFAGGLSQKLGQVKEFVRDDYRRTKEDLTSAVQGGRSITEQAKEKVVDTATSVQAKAQVVSEQAKSLTEQVKDRLGDAAAQVQDTTQSASQQAKEGLSKVTDTLQNKATELKGKLTDAVDTIKESRDRPE